MSKADIDDAPSHADAALDAAQTAYRHPSWDAEDAAFAALPVIRDLDEVRTRVYALIQGKPLWKPLQDFAVVPDDRGKAEAHGDDDAEGGGDDTASVDPVPPTPPPSSSVPLFTLRPNVRLVEDLSFDELDRADLFRGIRRDFLVRVEEWRIFLELHTVDSIVQHLLRAPENVEPLPSKASAVKPSSKAATARHSASHASVASAANALAPSSMTGQATTDAASAASEATAIVFSGQGAQKVGMAAKLVEQHADARALFTQASEILGYDLLDVCLNGPQDKLDSTLVSQPAIFVTSMAGLATLPPEYTDRCVAAAGLSLGEYSALVCAGVLSFADALRIVHLRAQAMHEAATLAPSAMLGILGTDMTLPKVREIIDMALQGHPDDVLCISNVLCPGNTVISGHTSAIERAHSIAEASGAKKVVRLSVSGAFHSSLMEPARARLEAALREVAFAQPRFPIVTNVDAQLTTDPEQLRTKLVLQLVEPVQWHDCMAALLSTCGARHVTEVGPGSVVTGLLRRYMRQVKPKPSPTLRSLAL